jgi:hypothetical protein
MGCRIVDTLFALLLSARKVRSLAHASERHEMLVTASQCWGQLIICSSKAPPAHLRFLSSSPEASSLLTSTAQLGRSPTSPP